MPRSDPLKFDDRGLIPAVVQDDDTGEVLTVAYVSVDSLARMKELGETVFHSRSRDQLWHKGETSGNTQKVVGVAADCDRDAILIRVRPRGPACHTGARSCFFEEVADFPSAENDTIGATLVELERLISDRRESRPEGSYTTRLFDRGQPHILQKVGEEAVETVIAGMSGDRAALIRESADLLYHWVVALQGAGISLEEVAAELRARRK